MARIAGIDIPREKRVEIALTYIYGIGLPTSQKILKTTSVNPDTRVRDLTEEQVNRLREVIDRGIKVEGDLRRQVALDIKRLIEIGSYRGMVRRMVAILLEVGHGKMTEEEVREAIAARTPARNGAMAPARGLCLRRVVLGRRDGRNGTGERSETATGHED